MAKANCTQEPEVLDLKTLFHELIILAEAQQFVVCWRASKITHLCALNLVTS